VKDLLPPRWGLNVWIPLQGLRSASPRYTPAYDLAAPNGAFQDTNEILYGVSPSAYLKQQSK